MKNKKVLVTDYDDTLTNDKKYLKENIEEIKKFRKNGNIFVIATGRSYKSIKDRIKKEAKGLEYDYLITNHGASIFDSCDNLLKSTNIAEETLNKILNIIDKRKMEKIYKYNEKKEVLTSNKFYNKIMFVYNDKFTSQLDWLKIKNLRITNAYLISREKQLPKVEVVSKRVNKASAIEYISEFENSKKVYVIGDASQDYEMIKKYKGYCVKNATEEIKKISKKEYNSVSEFIKDIKVV